jgi:hypothetical protein
MTTHHPASFAIQYRLAPTSPRPTPPPGKRQFRDALGSGSQALLMGVESAAALLPGRTVASAAVRGTVGAPSRASAGAAEAPAGPPSGDLGLPDTLRMQMDQSLQYLHLQEQISAENRRFSALSNVMKARHDTAKSAINNIK